jgi:hypothetical protein
VLLFIQPRFTLAPERTIVRLFGETTKLLTWNSCCCRMSALPLRRVRFMVPAPETVDRVTL